MCLLATHAVKAATVSLVPTTPINGLAVGDIVSFDIVMDFSDDPVFGGGFDVVYDPSVLQLDAFVRNPLIGDPDLSFDPVVSQGLLDDWTVNDLGGLPVIGLLGDVTFSILTTLPTTVALTDARDQGAQLPFDLFWVSTDFSSEVFVDYNSVTVNAIPLPGAVWLLGSAISLLWLRSSRAGP